MVDFFVYNLVVLKVRIKNRRHLVALLFYYAHDDDDDCNCKSSHTAQHADCKIINAKKSVYHTLIIVPQSQFVNEKEKTTFGGLIGCFYIL